MRVLYHPSPNFGPRRGGAWPNLVVLHHTAMESAESAVARLCDPAAEVSAHYVIAEDGRIWRLVAESERAWHAGQGGWGAVRDVNSHSIGIELANAGPLRGFPPFPEPQMTVLEALLDEIMGRWGIAPARVIAHSDMAPGRKADPGPKFDWRRLARGGRSIWPEAGDAGPCDPAAFIEAAGGIGYPVENSAPVLEAFRLRFRPWGRGALAPEDVGLARSVARAFPCVDPMAESA